MIPVVCTVDLVLTHDLTCLVLPDHPTSHANQGITTRVARSTLPRLQPRGKTIELVRSDGDDDADVAAAADDIHGDACADYYCYHFAWHGLCHHSCSKEYRKANNVEKPTWGRFPWELESDLYKK